MSITQIAGRFFVPRQKELEKHFSQPEELQHRVLARLMAAAADTESGRDHLFG